MSYRSIGSDMRAMMAATSFALRNLCLFSLLFLSLLSLFCSLAIDQFNLTFQPIIDNHAPIIRRSVTFRPYATWFTDEIKAAKTKRRKLERRCARITLKLIIFYTPNTVVC